MLTRETLDKLLPDNATLTAAVFRIAGSDVAYDLTSGLGWLQEFTERQRKNRFRDHKFGEEMIYPITAGGLEYKHSGQYLTQLGWRLGDQCWLVRVDSGYRHIVTGETPELALLRAIVIMVVLEKMQREGNQNGRIEEAIKKEMAT